MNTTEGSEPGIWRTSFMVAPGTKSEPRGATLPLGIVLPESAVGAAKHPRSSGASAAPAKPCLLAMHYDLGMLD